ncbi:DUF4062 domain-containing protein [Methanobrevibacter ruminantium]|nr:DUF4062 domain-containing protein [Methanobrevibacter ruminantium]
MEWKYATIFISSSFIDMHAERDYLIKKVFPELEEWCEEHKIHLSNIDLRWGVPEEISNNKSTIEKCLINIDESRPFFLCFLAQRRGWIPDFAEDISDDTFKRYEEIAAYSGLSATEMEIEHALLSPLKDFLNDDDELPENLRTRHSLFFIRDKSSLDEITDAQKRVYTNYGLVDAEHGEFIPGEYDSEGNCIREPKIIDDLSLKTKEIIEDADNSSQKIVDRIIKMKGDCDLPEDEKKVHIEITKYTGDWNRNLKIPEIEALTNKDKDDPEKKVRRYNDYEWMGRLSNFKEVKEDYKDISLIKKSENIESKIGRPLKDVIIEQMKRQLELEFPENFKEDEDLTEEERILQNELNQQDNFAYLNSQGYIPIKKDTDILSKYIEDADESRICLVSSEAGFGKTMLLANLAIQLEKKYTNKYDETRPNQKAIYKRFCGASNLSSKAFSLWDTIIQEAGLTEDDDFKIPKNLDELKKSIDKILDKISQKGESVIIIDAVNQMPDGLEMLKWLPAPESSNLKIIISCKEDNEDKELCLESLKFIKDRNAICPYFEDGHEDELGGEYKNYSFELKALEDCKNEKTKIINAYLKNYLKELSNKDIETICSFDASKNPLFLKVLLAELRVFASFEKLRDEIQEFIKDEFADESKLTSEDSSNHSDDSEGSKKQSQGSPKTAFNHVLERLEHDEDLVEGEALVPLIFALLANARVGLSRDEMASIIKAAKPDLDDEYIRDTINLNLRQVKPFMARKEGRDDFFYESFKLAAQERYAPKNIPKNERLNEYFKDKEDSDKLINVNALLADYFLKDALGQDSADSNDKTLDLSTIDGFNFKGENIRSYNELPYHANESRDFDRLKDILSSYSFIKNKINLSDINNLIVDYQFKDFEDAQHPFIKDEEDHSIVLIGRALELSAPILSDDKSELPAQLYGRMVDLRDDEVISPLIDEIEADYEMVLKPKSNSLYSPKSSIIKRPKVNGTKSTSSIEITDDKLLISANEDGTLNLFDLESNDLEILEEPHDSKVIRIIPTDEGQNMLMASSNGQINKWDINNRSIFKDDDNIYPKINANITDIYLSGTYNKIYASSHEGIFTIDLDTKELCEEKEIEHKKYNQILVPRRNEAILVCDEKEVDGWDVYEKRKAYNRQHQQNPAGEESSTQLDSSEEIRFMGLNKRFLTLISENGQMKFWNTLKNSGGGESIDEAQVCSPHDKFAQAITLEKEDQIITISDMGVLRVWNIPRPRQPKFEIAKIEGSDIPMDIQTGIKSPTAIDYFTDGDERWVIVANENNDISVIDLNKKVEANKETKHSESVLSIKIDGNHMITASDNGEIFAWDLNKEECINKFASEFRVNSISYDRDKSQLLLSGVKKEKDGNKIYKIASRDATDMWEPIKVQDDGSDSKKSKKLIDLNADDRDNPNPVIDIAQISDGMVFIEEKKISMPDYEAGFDKKATSLATQFDSNLAFVGFEDGSISSYPRETEFDAGINSPVVKIRVSGDRLVAGFKDGSVVIFDLSGTKTASFKAHDKAITNIYLDESRLITISEDKTLKFWKNDECTYTYFLDIFATSVSVNDGKLILGDTLGNLRFFEL